MYKKSLKRGKGRLSSSVSFGKLNYLKENEARLENKLTELNYSIENISKILYSNDNLTRNDRRKLSEIIVREKVELERSKKELKSVQSAISNLTETRISPWIKHWSLVTLLVLFLIVTPLIFFQEGFGNGVTGAVTGFGIQIEELNSTLNGTIENLTLNDSAEILITEPIIEIGVDNNLILETINVASNIDKTIIKTTEYLSTLALPVISNVILNSTNMTANSTDDNLTLYWDVSDTDGDNVKNITDWRLNKSSIAVLNMPFENISDSVFNATKDYSGNSNNGSEHGGVLWNATGGYDGKGAYEFDGLNDYISIPDDNSLEAMEG
ncbi:MAG: hypothetical protein Q8Q01_01010, partial [archaeon]|nr:hypothetical protein [archaeon]